MDNFKTELITDLVPRVKEMLNKEREHLRFLVNARTEFYKKNLPLREINEMIDCSESMIKHYEVRIKQYTEYAKNH